MRTRKTIVNTICALVEELVVIICSFILPRLILSAYGSAYNGLTTSITQFLSCAILLRSGIGGATRTALYKPVANDDKNKINAIVKATDLFMKRIGLILAVVILILAIVYPVFVIDEFEWFFSFLLFIIIGISTFAETFFCITYLIVLQADQMVWVASIIRSICYAVNVVVAAFLIAHGSSIHIVKLGSAFVFGVYPIILQIYVKKKYSLNLNVEPDNSAIKQRWDVFWNQISVFIMNNTDIMVLTVFSNVWMVSVYSVYNLVVNGLRRLINSFSEGIEAAFGNMIAKNEYESLIRNLSLVEFIMYSLSSVVFSCAIILILQFVRVYTNGIDDVNYIKPAFAYIILIAQFFNSIRLPYQMVVQAAGHYKQTRNGAIVEPILNITISIVFVIRFGLVGVAIGTLVATLFRSIQFSTYMSKNIINRNISVTIKKILTTIIEMVLAVAIMHFIGLDDADGYRKWFFNALITLCVSGTITVIGGWLLYRDDFEYLLAKLKLIKRRV